MSFRMVIYKVNNIGAVSYTHLDVYKRQGLYLPFRIEKIKESLIFGFLILPFIGFLQRVVKLLTEGVLKLNVMKQRQILNVIIFLTTSVVYYFLKHKICMYITYKPKARPSMLIEKQYFSTCLLYTSRCV